MTSTTSRALRRSMAAFAAATLLAACAERTPAGPDGGYMNSLSPALLTSAEAAAASFGRLPDLGICQDVQVPEGSKLSFHVFGEGVQIYRWDGASWMFVNPSADLYADAQLKGLVGTHFGGPTWLTLSGSSVVGTVTHRCFPSTQSIPWLRLDAVADGSGIFENTKFIQRTNTVGGIAPAAPGTIVGEVAEVPYTADYFFYRAP
jgi:hypothetical protein